MNITRKPTVAFFVLIATLPVATVNALPIEYSLTLEVDTVLEIFGYPSDPVYQVGNRYSGSFVIDDAILQNDGVNQAGDLLEFAIEIEEFVWSMNLPWPLSDFRGFVGPGGYYAPSPGFDVQNGEIINLRGGVFGLSDFPFVDFACLWCGGDNSFSAVMVDDGGTGRSEGVIQGSLNITRIQVPEPGTLALLGLGLTGMGMTRRKK